MPNWKKIIVSGSDASLSSAYIDGNLTASAAYLTSASIGHLETIYETASVIYSSGSTKFGDTLDDTHEITGSLLVSSSITSISASIDNLTANDKLQLGGAGSQFFAYNEDTIKVKFANWYSSTDRQYGMGQLWFETWFAAIDNQASRDNRRIGFYLEEPDAGSTDSGTPGQHPSNARFYIDIEGAYLSGSLNVEQSITGSEISASLIGTASIADLATTASHTAGTASIANTAVTSSHTAGTASIANNATTSSYTLTGDGVFSGSFSGSFQGDASELNVNPFPFTGSGEMQGKLTVESFQDYVDEDYVEQYFAGTAIASSGDIALTGSIFSPYINANSFTGSLSGSATSASLAETASYFNGTVTSASLAETASFYGGSVISASFAETASFYGGDVTSASLAETASFYGGSVTSASLAETASYMTTGSFKQPVQFVKTEPATASLYHLHIMSASSAITMSLPSGSPGDWFKVSNMRTGSLLESFGSQNIMSASGDLTLDTANAGLELIYTDNINGWVIIGN